LLSNQNPPNKLLKIYNVILNHYAPKVNKNDVLAENQLL